MSCRCYIVPPHLLKGIADSVVNPEHVRKAAQASLAAHERVTGIRKDRFATLGQPRGFSRTEAAQSQHQHIVPDTLLRHLSTSENVDEATRSRAKQDLEHLETVLTRVRDSQQGLRTFTRTHHGDMVD